MNQETTNEDLLWGPNEEVIRKDQASVKRKNSGWNVSSEEVVWKVVLDRVIINIIISNLGISVETKFCTWLSIRKDKRRKENVLCQ